MLAKQAESNTAQTKMSKEKKSTASHHPSTTHAEHHPTDSTNTSSLHASLTLTLRIIHTQFLPRTRPSSGDGKRREHEHPQNRQGNRPPPPLTHHIAKPQGQKHPTQPCASPYTTLSARASCARHTTTKMSKMNCCLSSVRGGRFPLNWPVAGYVELGKV